MTCFPVASQQTVRTALDISELSFVKTCPNTSLHQFTSLHFLLWYVWFPDGITIQHTIAVARWYIPDSNSPIVITTCNHCSTRRECHRMDTRRPFKRLEQSAYMHIPDLYGSFPKPIPKETTVR